MASAARKNAVLDMISQGEYVLDPSTMTTGLTWTKDTPYHYALVSNPSGTQDCLVSWVRSEISLSSASTAPCRMTVLIYKGADTDAAPTVNSAWITQMRDQGRLFMLKQYTARKLTNGPQVPWKDQFFNVKLRVGECLWYVVINRSASIADGQLDMWVEKRILEVGA